MYFPKYSLFFRPTVEGNYDWCHKKRYTTGNELVTVNNTYIVTGKKVIKILDVSKQIMYSR